LISYGSRAVVEGKCGDLFDHVRVLRQSEAPHCKMTMETCLKAVIRRYTRYHH
jgi:hypothetical protein